MDFNEYAKNNQGSNDKTDIFNLVNSLAKKYDGKSQNELLAEIIKETKKRKANGTLSNAEIDSFASMISPMLDNKQRGMLNKIVKELKKI